MIMRLYLPRRAIVDGTYDARQSPWFR